MIFPLVIAFFVVLLVAIGVVFLFFQEQLTSEWFVKTVVLGFLFGGILCGIEILLIWGRINNLL